MALEISSSTVVCAKCGTGFGRRAGNFYKSYAQNYKGINHLTICKKCTDELFENYLTSCADAKLAMRQVCRKLDIYWNEEAYEYVLQRNVTKNLVSAYMQRMSTAANVGKSYDDTLVAEGTVWAFGSTADRQKEIDDAVAEAVAKVKAEYEESKQAEIADAVADAMESMQSDDEDIEIPESVVTFWGPAYTPEMYLELEERRKYWMKKLKYDDDEELDAGIEALIRQICGLEIDINRERACGKTPDKLVSTLSSLISSAQLRPDQKKEDISKADATTPFGVWIRRWEDERPIPEVDPSLKDVDGILKYISAWFIGHLSKMLGIKRAEMKVYEDEVSRLRVERPEYNEDDDEEFLNDLFADTTSYESGGDDGDQEEDDI